MYVHYVAIMISIHTVLKHLSFLFHQRKKIILVWNNVRMSWIKKKWVNYFFIITPYLPLWQMRSKEIFLSERREIHLVKTLKFYPPPSFSAQSVSSLQRVSMKLAAIAHLSSCFIQVHWNHAERCSWEELISITLMFDERRKTRYYRENEWGSLINAERV